MKVMDPLVSLKLIKEAEFDAFAHWIALPSILRKPKSHGEFGEKYDVHKTTLSGWKRTDEFWSRVKEYRKEWIRPEFSDVIRAVIREVKKDGDAARFKILAEMFDGYIEKKEIIHATQAEKDALVEIHQEWKEFCQSRGAKVKPAEKIA